MEKIKKQNGITLIALVITVIVLLILAGVAVSLLSSDRSVMQGAQEASSEYSIGASEEKSLVDMMNNKIDEYKVEDAGGVEPEEEPGGELEEEGNVAELVEVGDYINYDAGSWTTADFTKITSSTGSPKVNKSKNLPTTQGQFGGFTLNQSRNTNSTPYDSDYTPDYSGWRVWDIDEETGEVTIISAGHPETYYHYSGNSSASVNILTNRDCSMYENEYAQSGSAKILTGQEAAKWYNKQYGTSYTIVENGGSSSSTFYNNTFSIAEPISVLENGSNYWLASAYNTDCLYFVAPNRREVGAYGTSGYGAAMRCPRINHSRI